MVIARGGVQKKIDSVKSSIGNTVSVSPAGVQGFEGGGEPLTQAQIDKIKNLTHVASVTETLQDRLNSDDTTLESSIEAGSLGQRFRSNGSNSETTNGPTMVINGSNADGSKFTPPITVGASTNLNSSEIAKDGSVDFTSGKAFDIDSTENVAIVGKAIAEKNSLKVGSTFTAYGAEIKVVGIYDTGNTFTNNSVVFPMETLQKLSDQADQISTATLTVDSIENVSSVVKAVQSKLGDAADVTDNVSTAESALAPLENIKTISMYSLIGAVVAGAVIILLTMVMIVRERRREIGVLKAIGASNVKVMFQFMSEAVTFTALGALIGTAVGVVGGSPITKVLVNNSTSSSTAGGAGGGPVMVGRGAGEALRNIGLNGQGLRDVHAVVGWDTLAYGLGAALFIAIVGSAVAALLIAKVRPAEVMRAE